MTEFDDGLDDQLLVAAATEYMEESSDEEPKQWGGSMPGKAKNKNRDFAGAYTRLVADYFNGPDSVYDEADCERRFRLPRQVFDRIQSRIIGHGCFVQKMDATKKQGVHPLVRLTACLRKLAYGTADDQQDEYLRLSETLLNNNIKEFA